MNAIERLPVPYWLTYLAFFILESLVLLVASWLDGWLPAYKFNPIILLYPLWLWGPFAIITYMNSVSREAISSFAPLLNIPDSQLEELKTEFTTIPSPSVLLSGVFWSIIYILFVLSAYQSFIGAYGIGTTMTIFYMVIGLISYSLGSIIYYHSIRQLRLVNRTLKMVGRFNLFHLDPVYAFSQVTSRIGIAWMVMLSLTLLTFPVQIAPIPLLSLLLIQVALAITAFVLPLRVVHHQLVLEKRKLLAGHHIHVETALAELHHRIEQKELGDMTQLNSAIIGLNTERDILNKIPTWPWRAGMLKDFLSIVILPIILFLVQLALSHWLIK